MLEIKYLQNATVSQSNCQNIVYFKPFELYTDGSNKLAFISFTNKFNEALTSITFKISQFDENNKCLKREIKTIKDLAVRHKKSFKTEELLKVDVMLHHVEIEILNMAFITIVYDHGSLASACVKVDKAAKRREKVLRKWNEKHPNGISKRYLKEIRTYNFNKNIKTTGLFISLICCSIMLILIALIGCLYCKFPSHINPFYILFKGGLF